jgi:hypothetical protein
MNLEVIVSNVSTALYCLMLSCSLIVIYVIFTARSRLKVAAKMSEDIDKGLYRNNSPKANQIRLYVITTGIFLFGFLCVFFILVLYMASYYMSFPLPFFASIPKSYISLFAIAFLLVGIVASAIAAFLFKKILPK